MNRTQVLEELKTRLNLDDEKVTKIGEISDDISLIGKSNKEKMVSMFIEELNVTEEEANTYYETLCSIVAGGIKEKLKHPFRDLDKERK